MYVRPRKRPVHTYQSTGPIYVTARNRRPWTSGYQRRLDQSKREAEHTEKLGKVNGILGLDLYQLHHRISAYSSRLAAFRLVCLGCRRGANTFP